MWGRLLEERQKKLEEERRKEKQVSQFDFN